MRDSSVGLVTTLQNEVSIPDRDKRFLSSPQCADRLQVHQGSYLRGTAKQQGRQANY
jgi:hypothetical protein